MDNLKGIFPYNKWTRIEDVIATTDFPEHQDFFSLLKMKNVDIELWEDAKKIYDYHHTTLNENDPDYWANMSDWLKYYNLLDVTPFLRAIENQFKKLGDAFSIVPLEHLSLPSMAMRAMFNNFDQRFAYCSAFSRKSNAHKVRQLFRQNVIGGLTNVFHRHIDLGFDERSDIAMPATARYLNQSKYTNILALDFNSMYLYAQGRPMPTTPGLEWDVTKRCVIKRSLLSQVSFGQLQWLYWLQATFCHSREGERLQLQHAYFQGEQCVICDKISCVEHKMTADGALEKDGKQYYFEYYGCWFHHCDKCGNKHASRISPDVSERRARKQLEKEQIMRSKGILIIKHECEWMRERKTLSSSTIKTEMPRILNRNDDETSLLSAIGNGSIYGFLVADVKTDDSVIENTSKDFLFPFIIKRMTLDASYLSPFMASQMDENKRKTYQSSTVVQGYNATQLFMLSTQAKFYLDAGMKITNVTKFIQFIQAPCLLPFVNKVIGLRTQARRSKDKPKEQTAKMIGNSGYGKTAEDVTRHRQSLIFGDVKKFKKKMLSPLVINHSLLCREIDCFGGDDDDDDNSIIELTTASNFCPQPRDPPMVISPSASLPPSGKNTWQEYQKCCTISTGKTKQMTQVIVIVTVCFDPVKINLVKE